jgi:hypothetical protein
MPRPLKIGLYVGVASLCLSVLTFLRDLETSQRELQTAYLQAGIPGWLGEIVGYFVLGPAFFAIVAVALTWLWSKMFPQRVSYQRQEPPKLG